MPVGYSGDMLVIINNLDPRDVTLPEKPKAASDALMINRLKYHWDRDFTGVPYMYTLFTRKPHLNVIEES